MRWVNAGQREKGADPVYWWRVQRTAYPRALLVPPDETVRVVVVQVGTEDVFVAPGGLHGMLASPVSVVNLVLTQIERYAQPGVDVKVRFDRDPAEAHMVFQGMPEVTLF